MAKYNDTDVANKAVDLILNSECAFVITNNGSLMYGNGLDVICALCAQMAMDKEILVIFKEAVAAMDSEVGQQAIRMANEMRNRK